MAGVAENELVVLIGLDGERHIVAARRETSRVAGLGVVDLQAVIGRSWGSTVRLGLKDYRLMRPVLADHVRSLERTAQIITAKDASRILFETGLGAGDRVVEAGVGSGALTTVLAHAVFPGGRVHAFERREDHLAKARRNLERTPWAGSVEFVLGDVHVDVTQRDVDAFVLDVPDPEKGAEVARDALRSGGVFVAYTPLINQARQALEALKKAGFIQVRTFELLERAWVLHEQGMRPDFEMLGHTGFLTVARRP